MDTTISGLSDLSGAVTFHCHEKGDGVIELAKGGNFDDWISDSLAIVHPENGRRTTAGEVNRQSIHRLIDRWIDGQDITDIWSN